MEGQRAPAAAHVEHLLARPQQQLGRDVALLRPLRLLDILLTGRKVGAGVLPLAVEEELVEGTREVVMVGDVGLGTLRRVELVEAPQQPAKGAAEAVAREREADAGVDAADLEEVAQVALFHDQASVDIGLGHRQTGVQQHLALDAPIGEADRGPSQRLLALELVAAPARVDHPELALPDEPSQEAFDQHALYAVSPRPLFPPHHWLKAKLRRVHAGLRRATFPAV